MMNRAKKTPRNIVVIGAGIGGLMVGIALKKQGYHVTIYEKVTEILPVGAAILLWSNGVKCLSYLGNQANISW